MADQMVRCDEGHFYDASKHHSCPWCGVPGGLEQLAARTGPPPLPNAGPPPVIPPTRPLGQEGGAAAGSGPGRTVGMGEQSRGSSPGVTKRYLGDAEAEAGFDPVVGWLVCTEGPDRGRDYRIRMAKNFIGRAPSMSISIAGDETISRDKHAAITFEPKKQSYWLLPGDSSGLVYLNGEVVHSPSPLRADDVIELGKTKLLFVPLCGEKFSW